MTVFELEQVAAELNKSRNKVAFSVREAAEALGVGRSTMFEYINMEGFPAYKLGGKTFIDVQGLRDWSARNAAERVGYRR